MRYLAVMVIVLGAFTGVQAQMKFETGSWDKVLKKAQKKDKFIFVDCYTTWCGPCKLMDKKVFVDEKVADFYNDNYISYKIDMESPEGLQFAQYFLASVYPTFYFLDSEGNTLYKTAGYHDPEKFLALGTQAMKEDVKKKYGKIDIVKEKAKEQEKRKNQYVGLVASKGYEVNEKPWEEVLADAKANGKDVLAIVGDGYWPIPEAMTNEEARTYLQQNFEIYPKSFSESYVRDENGDIIKDAEGNMKQDEWMEKYPLSVFPGIVIIDTDGNTLITGSMTEALELGKAVRADYFKPEVGFWPSTEGTAFDFAKQADLEQAMATTSADKPLLIQWYRPGRNLLPIYEDPEVMAAIKEQFVPVAICKNEEGAEELFKKYGGQTYGSNGALSVVSKEGQLMNAARIPSVISKEDMLKVLEQLKQSPAEVKGQ